MGTRRWRCKALACKRTSTTSTFTTNSSRCTCSPTCSTSPRISSMGSKWGMCPKMDALFGHTPAPTNSRTRPNFWPNIRQWPPKKSCLASLANLANACNSSLNSWWMRRTRLRRCAGSDLASPKATSLARWVRPAEPPQSSNTTWTCLKFRWLRPWNSPSHNSRSPLEWASNWAEACESKL